MNGDVGAGGPAMAEDESQARTTAASSPPRLAGKVALVTGAGAGIGRAIAHAFAAEGASVVCLDIDGDAAEAVAEETRGAGVEASGDAIAVACDVADAAGVQAAVDRTRERYGALHVLVNNAAREGGAGLVTDLDLDDWRRTLDVNLTGAFLLCRAAIPLMAESGGGSVINVASQLGHVALGRSAAYCATKAALIHLSRVIALDHAAQGIRANSLSPGAVETPRLLGMFGDMDRARRYLEPKHILGRLGEPHEIAAAAVFLASDESSFMTGADMLVDGGYTASV